MSEQGNTPTLLKLNINKWLCGNNTSSMGSSDKIGMNHFGIIEPSLYDENQENHNMCCLGQFLNQAGIDKEMLDGGQPSDIDPEHLTNANRTIISLLVNIDDKEGKNIIVGDTTTTKRLIEINDSQDTTIFEKINKMSQVLKENGVSLVVDDTHGELKTVKQLILQQQTTLNDDIVMYSNAEGN